MPEATLNAVADHGGDGSDTVTGHARRSRQAVIAGLRALGIDIDEVTAAAGGRGRGQVHGELGRAASARVADGLAGAAEQNAAGGAR